jgi:hypothetical protein
MPAATDDERVQPRITDQLLAIRATPPKEM